MFEFSLNLVLVFSTILDSCHTTSIMFYASNLDVSTDFKLK